MNTPRRSLIIVASLGLQMCLGATYAWSVFVLPLRETTGLSQATVQLPFTVFYFAFPATMLFAGTILNRLGPQRCALVGGILFGSGWILASLGSYHFVFTVLGIGLLAGIGVGCAYVVPIAVLVRWFPERRGLVTGVAVAGFGGGAALISQVSGLWLIAGSTSPFYVFLVLGILFCGVTSLASRTLRFPSGTTTSEPPLLSTTAIVSHPTFRLLYLAMVTGLAAGFMINANLKELSTAGALTTGVAAVSLFAVANALGRLTWGYLFDRTELRTVISANLIFQACSVIVFSCGTGAGLVVFAMVAGFNYGGVLVLYASAVARVWGTARVGQVYGLLFSANILAAPAPILAGLVYDSTGTFHAALFVVAALMVLSAMVILRRA